MSVCKHGKPPATSQHMREYKQRPECVERGDCTCYLCSKVCWAGDCYLRDPREVEELEQARRELRRAGVIP